MERVSIIRGKKPVIFVCPHGADDTNTTIIAETAAKELDAFAVINRGFRRSEEVDANNDEANCNRVDHVYEDVVYEEFLAPLEKLTSQLSKGFAKQQTVHIFHIHGCGNTIHKLAGEKVEIVVGYGLGLQKDSLSCDIWRKNLFVDMYRTINKQIFHGEIYEGKPGGKYAGRDKNNMNQYFRKQNFCEWVQSMQLEFPFSVRDTESGARFSGLRLVDIVLEYLEIENYTGQPTEKFI